MPPGTVLTLCPAPAPVAKYFLKVVRINPADLTSPLTGTGRFNFEAWLLEKAGVVDLSHKTKPDLQAVQFYFDGVLPFIVLLLVSLLTKAPEREKVNYFFGKMKTPVGVTAELEVATMEDIRCHRRALPLPPARLCRDLDREHAGLGTDLETPIHANSEIVIGYRFRVIGFVSITNHRSPLTRHHLRDRILNR